LNSTIRIELKDWLYNAGIVGFINIIKKAGDEYSIKDKELFVSKKVLEEFEDKYFKYFIDTYENYLPWKKIVDFEDFVSLKEREGLKNISQNDIDIINRYIGSSTQSGTLKYLLKKSSYKSAYKLIGSPLSLEIEDKNLNQIKLKKNQKVEEKTEDIRKALDSIKKIINFFKIETSKKYLAGKDVIYIIIKNAWTGVSFLNPQTKNPNFYLDFKSYFIDPVKEYLKDDKSRYKYSCFTCNRKMENLKNDLSFLNMTGFDTNRKPSHVWNYINDISICPLCKLIYACVPAGFTYVYNRGIFINENHNLDNIQRINNSIKHEILDKDTSGYNLFAVLTKALNESIDANIKYEIADIQLVRYENDNYRFNFLSKKILKVLFSNKEQLDSLINCFFRENNLSFNIYDEVIKKIFNSENLFSVIHKCLLLKITRPADTYYNNYHIGVLLRINNSFLEEMVFMNNSEKDLIKSANAAGYYLRQAYIQKKADNKLGGISYRLLNALKTNNTHMFMDVLINCYLYTNNSVPVFFTEGLKDSNVFKNIGYSFVSGLIEGTQNKN
jgi:CRISPR-associated protein Cst1